MDEHNNLPDFDALPSVDGMPQGCAWGVFDRNGKKDVFGCLNLLTPSVIKEAVKEVQYGISISLNWGMASLAKPGHRRKGLVHHVIPLDDDPNPKTCLHGFDDELEFNTQCSSQWDSLVHYTFQQTQVGYNGCKPTREALLQPFGSVDTTRSLPTLEHWHGRGGVVGRGVLLDYRAYVDAHGIAFDCFTDDKLHVEDLEKVARWEGVEFRQGDIPIIRTGYVEELAAAKTGAEQDKLTSSHRACGVYGSIKTAKWFWNHHFAAVASDNLGFENIPPQREDGSDGDLSELVLHPYFLCLFGLPIGELWDLKELSRVCMEKKKYTFLLTSAPLNVPGAVSSPPNAIAIL